MRAISLAIALVGLTACGVTKQVKYSSSEPPTTPAPLTKPAEPAASMPVMTMPPLPSVSHESSLSAADLPQVNEPTVAAAPTSAEGDRLQAVLVDYRTEVENILTLIWAKPLPEVTDAGALTGYTYAIDRLIKTNGKLQNVPHLSEADHKMLVDGAEVMTTVRGNLIDRRAELAKSAN